MSNLGDYGSQLTAGSIVHYRDNQLTLITEKGKAELPLTGESDSAPTFHTLALYACRSTLEEAGLEAKEIPLILVATFTPEVSMPAAACLLQRDLKAEQAGGCDITGGGSNSSSALVSAATMVQTGTTDHILLVSGDLFASFNRNHPHAHHFEDTVTAVLVSRSTENHHGLQDYKVLHQESAHRSLSYQISNSHSILNHPELQAEEHLLNYEPKNYKNSILELYQKFNQDYDITSEHPEQIVGRQDRVSGNLISRLLPQLWHTQQPTKHKVFDWGPGTYGAYVSWLQ